jgi:CHAT domain-containing protein/Tfp pilus assembly protein PilF
MAARQEADARPLEPGRPVIRELAGGESHSYRIALAAGQFVSVVFDQRGINLVISLYGSDGRKIADADSPNGAHGPEVASLVAEVSGDYRLEARSLQPGAPKGSYEVKIEELRPAMPGDKTRVAAERAFAEATLIGGQGTAEAQRKAIEKYEEAIPLWQSLKDSRQEAYTLSAIGHCYETLGDYEKALEFYGRALPLRRAAGDRSGEALALYNIGSGYSGLGEPQRALDFYNQALSIYRSIGDQFMEAAALGNLGALYSGRGRQREALEFFNQALALKRALRDPYGEATLLNNIGLTCFYLGEHQKALEFYNKALPIYRAINYRSGEATTLNNIGTLYGELGEYEKELEFLEQVLQIKRAAGNRIEEAITLNNIGVAYGYLGEHRKSLENYNQALPLSRGARSTEATTLSNIGKAYSDLGDYRRALDFYEQSLPIKREAGDRRGEAVTLMNIGRARQGLGDCESAIDFYNRALLIRRAVEDRGGEAVTLYNLARAYRDLNNLTEARAQIEAAISIVESLRSKVASQGLRASYLASVQKYYELGVDLLMRLRKEHPSEDFAAAALHLCERGRARALLELLTEARVDIRQGVAPALLEREQTLRQSLDAESVAQTRLLGRGHSPEQAAAAAKAVGTLTTEYEQVQAEIRSSSPRYAALTQPTPLCLKEIQDKALDPDTLLLEYSLGAEKSYLWAVTQTSIETFELPGRAEVEAAARRVYEILTARNRSLSNETPEQRRRRVDVADAEYPKAAAALSRLVLGPVASQLKTRRLLIVADGALQYAPFAALPEPSSQPAVASNPLVLKHEIVNLPSASVLAALRRETAGRAAAAKTLAVFADPVYRDDDSRIGQGTAGRPGGNVEALSNAEVQRAASESGVEDFLRLRFSRQEAEEIARFAPADKKFEALDFAASRATATRADLDQYRIVHFATHALINNRHPELSGLVLSLVDDQGRPQNGFLRLYEIYNLKLGADLVTLSACQTALGKEFRGEGLVGLTRGFMYAGAPRVAASLWRIDDRATAEMMKRFYQRMLGEGMTAAAALRAAQVSMWDDKRWSAPRYWAAFTLQGEWR